MKLIPSHPLAPVLERDPRYAPAAYAFVFEALRYGQKVLSMGSDAHGEEQHVSGQQLCEAIRRYALDQFGFMAKCVLNSWGVHKSGDFGNIVFNLIQVEQMKKTSRDRREDFEDVFDFDTGLAQSFKITLPECIQ